MKSKSGWFMLFVALGAFQVEAAETKLTWHGHAAFEIVTPKGKVILIDPWINNPVNPKARGGKDAAAGIGKADYILLTHGHNDHVGDSVKIAKKTGARLIANPELGNNLARIHKYPSKQMGFDTLMNMGGEISIADGEVTVVMTPAVHSSGLSSPNEKPGHEKPVAYGGNPVGFVLKIKDGPTIYHTGDTAYFGDMTLIGESHAPDVSLINIGGHFGMEPAMAAKAAEAVKSRLVIPHHFGTFPILTPNAESFATALREKRIPFREMQAGSTLVFEGRTPKSRD